MTAQPYTIVPASVRHIRPMAKVMRAAGSIALGGLGFDPRAALRRAYVASFYSRTALIDDHPAAMWGAAGTLLHDSAYVWLVLSDEVRNIPRAIVHEARAELEHATRDCREVSATVLPDDEASVRFAKHLGFEGDETENRFPIGDGFAVRLVWRPTYQAGAQ